MDFKLEISRDNSINSYYPVDLFPKQQLDYDVEFYDDIDIEKVKLPFYTDLRIPLTDNNKSANVFNFEPFSDTGADFPRDDFYFVLTIYGTQNSRIAGILNVSAVEYNSSQPYAEVVLKDYISKYLSQIKEVNLGTIYDDSFFTQRKEFSTFLKKTNDPTDPGESGIIGQNPEPSKAISFPYVDFVNDVKGKYNYAARQFLEYGVGLERAGVMPVFSVQGFFQYLAKYINDPINFPFRIDSELFAVGAFANNPLFPSMEPEKLQMVIPSRLLAKSDVNTRTFSVRQSPAWASPNESLEAKVDLSQERKLFYTKWFSSTETSGNYGTDGEGNPIYPNTQEWGVEKRMGFYPCEGVFPNIECNYIRGFFAPKVSFNAAITIASGGQATISNAKYEIPVIQEDLMVGDIFFSDPDSTMEFNVCIGIWADGLQIKEITMKESQGGNDLVLDMSNVFSVANGYSNKFTPSDPPDYLKTSDDSTILYAPNGPVYDTLVFEPFTAYMPSEEIFINGGSEYSINYYLKPIDGELKIQYATEFNTVMSGINYASASNVGLFNENDIRKAITRFGEPDGSGDYGQLNVVFVANEDFLPYKKTDEYILQESIINTCPFTVSDVLLNIAKRFDCSLFYDFDDSQNQHILRIDPIFSLRSSTSNINSYLDDIKSFKITNNGDKVKTLSLNNKDYNLFYDDLNNDGVTTGSTTQEISNDGIVDIKIDLNSSVYFNSVCGDDAEGVIDDSNLGVFSSTQLGFTPNIFTPNSDIGFRFAYIDKPLYKTNLLVPYMVQRGTSPDMNTETQRVYSNSQWGPASANLGGKHVFNGRLSNVNTAGWDLLFEDNLGDVTDTYTEIFEVSEKISQSNLPKIQFNMVVPTTELNNLNFFLAEFTSSVMTGGTIYVKSASGPVYEDFAYLTIEGLLR